MSGGDDRPTPGCMELALALVAVATGLGAALVGAGYWLWVNDLAVPATLAALLVFYMVSAPALRRGGAGRRSAAVGFRGPAAATFRPAAVVHIGSPGPRGRHRRLNLGAPPVPIPSALVLSGGAPSPGGVR